MGSTLIQTAWAGIKLVVTIALLDIESLLTGAMHLINGDWDKAWADIEAILKRTFGWMIDDAIWLKDQLVGKSIIPEMLDAILAIWTTKWDAVQSVLTTAFDNIKATAKAGINSIIGFIDDLISAWDKISFDIPGFSIELPSKDIPYIGHVGGGSLSWPGFHESVTQIAQIPLLAAGGIVTSPGLFGLGESGPEAVVPLSSASAFGFGGNQGGDTHIHVRIDLANAVIANDAALQDLVDKISKAFSQRYGLYSRHA